MTPPAASIMNARPPALLTLGLLAAFGLAPTALHASEGQRHRIGVNTRIAFRVEATFRNLGEYRSPMNPGPERGGGTDRFYEDGFVRVDASGNADGGTWYWGYEDSERQVVGDTVRMQVLEAPGGLTSSVHDDPHAGVELRYGYVWRSDPRARWLLEAALGWTEFDFTDRRTLTGPARRIVDAFPLDGVVPPWAAPAEPYSGSFAGPGPILGDAPIRTSETRPDGLVLEGERRLRTSLGTLRLGPAVEMPWTEQWSAQFGAGLALALADGEFTRSETLSPWAGPPVRRSGGTSDTEFLVGAYAEGLVHVTWPRGFSLFAGAQYQYLPDFRHALEGQEAVVRFSRGFFLIAGLRYGF